MIDLNLPLIGPAADLLPTLRQLPPLNKPFAVLAHGAPGCGKSHALDLFALELTGNKFAIEHLNGQSVDVAAVRQWKERGSYGNLFSKWTVKRIDELDRASDAAQAELLTWLDYLPPNYAILATTNNYRELCKVDHGRLQRRFKQYSVEGPCIADAVAYLRAQFKLGERAANAIVQGAKLTGELFSPVNMAAAVEDAQAFLAAKGAKQAA